MDENTSDFKARELSNSENEQLRQLFCDAGLQYNQETYTQLQESLIRVAEQLSDLGSKIGGLDLSKEHFKKWAEQLEEDAKKKEPVLIAKCLDPANYLEESVRVVEASEKKIEKINKLLS